MYGSQKDVKHNLKMFFLDGISFMPTMSLISITAVIPYFLDQLGASTFQIALAAAMTLICAVLTQPLFGVIASRAKIMHKTFGRILLLQRFIFLFFVLLIPIFAGADDILVVMFLVFWGIFNLFVGSYGVFHFALVIRLLPKGRRGGFRGVGLAIGSVLGVGMSLLIPVIIGNITFPYNYMTIFTIGIIFLFANAAVFLLMRQSEDTVPNEPMSLKRYLVQMPTSIRENPAFRAMIPVTMLLAIANALLPYYTLYAIREHMATETHIATLTGVAILFGAVAQILIGYIVDRYGPRITAMIVACLIAAAGILAISANSFSLLLVSWAFANMGYSGYHITITLMLGEISPLEKIPLYVGVHTTISMAISAVLVLLLAPVLEGIGFTPLFIIVLSCGLLSLLINMLVLKKRLS